MRRIRSAGINRPALFVSADLEIPPLPFENMKLVDVIAKVLQGAGKPLTLTEIVVFMLEGGYESQQTPKMLRNHVGTTMRKSGQRFLVSDRRWVFVTRLLFGTLPEALLCILFGF